MFGQAAKKLSQLKKRFPREEQVYTLHLELERKRKNYAFCNLILKEMLDKSGDSLAYRENRCRQLMLEFEFSEARDLCEKSFSEGYTSIPLYYIYADVLLGLEDWPAARQCLVSMGQLFGLKQDLYYPFLFAKAFVNEPWNVWEQYLNTLENEKQYAMAVRYALPVLEMDGLFEQAYQLVNQQLNILADQEFSIRIPFYFEQTRLQNLLQLQKMPRGQHLSDISFKASTEIPSRLNSNIQKQWTNIPELAELFSLHQSLLAEIGDRHADSFYLDTCTSPRDAGEVALRIIEAIRASKPFSLLRLGDGEGYFLPYDEKRKSFQKVDQAYIEHAWWQKSKLSGLKDQIVIRVSEAIQGADILGIPCFYGIFRWNWLYQMEGYISSPVTRGLLAVNQYIAKQGRQDPLFARKTITSCFIHHHLSNWGLYDYIFSFIRRCCVISCHAEIARPLEQLFQLAIQRLYLIPAEFSHASRFEEALPGEAHYPNRFNEICQSIEVAYPGEVYLVGAGYLGKIYCQIIKSKGGIALDVGSMLDYWMSHKTRHENNISVDADRLAIWYGLFGPKEDHVIPLEILQKLGLSDLTDERQLKRYQVLAHANNPRLTGSS